MRRRRSVGLVAALGGMLALTACGASHSAGESHRAAASTESSKGTAHVKNAHVKNGVCRKVSTPRPRGPQHIPKPTLRLDSTKLYTVRLETNCGAIEMQLYAQSSPKIAASFVYLVRRGFYDDLTFHRVVAGFVIQGGDPNGDGSGGPGYTVVEPPPRGVSYTKGTVAMAKAQTDPSGTAGSQFFIVMGSHADLPPQYALLGKVIGGEKTLKAISDVPTIAGPDGEKSEPAHAIVIREATVSVS